MEMTKSERIDHMNFVHLIATAKIEEVKKILFEGGVNINYSELHVGSPVVHALYSRNIEMFNLIIQAGGEINSQTSYSGRYGSDIINCWYDHVNVTIEFRETVRQEILRQDKIRKAMNNVNR